MDDNLIYPDATFRLLESFNGSGAKSTMAVEDETLHESVQESLQLLSAIESNSTEKQIETYMSSLADSFDDQVDVVVEALERAEAHRTVFSAMQQHFRNFKIQFHGSYVLLRLIELSPRTKLHLQGQPEAQRYILKIMARYADRTCQVVGCKIISALCTSSRTRGDAVSKGAVDSVLYAMSQFGEDEELYVPAFEALRGLLADDLKAQEKFMTMDVKNSRKKAYRMVVEIMEKHKRSGGIQEQGIQLMCILATSNQNCRAMFQARTFIVALEAMKRHQDYLGVQIAGCKLLVLLAAFEPHRATLVEQDIILPILHALKEFKDCTELQINGLSALAHLAEALGNKLQNGIQKCNWTKEVFAAVTTHYDKPEVLSAACYALRELIDVCPQVLEVVGDEPADNRLPLHRCVMAALMLHVDDLELCQEACQVLASMTINSSSLRESLMFKGLYINIIHVMEQHDKHPGVQRWGCRALRGLSLSGCSDKELLINCGVLELVFSCTQRYLDDVNVQEEAIALIACLATDVELVWRQSAIEGFHDMILKAMKTYPDDLFLAEISLEALGVLTAAEEIRELLVNSSSSEHDGVETIFNAMEKHRSERDIQQKGCILIQVLAPLLSDDYCQSALKALIDAMCEFQEDKGVQAEGCVAMFVIAQIDAGKSEMLVNNCAHERLFYILEQFAEEAELVYLASECIRYLAFERELKESMLLSACAGGLLKLADCLIKKGADVNAGDGVNSPLCWACKNEKEDMVRFLLTQGITDIQSALKLSLEMDHGNIVGLLLQYLSHDKEAGIIAFSNLNLGDLQPEWISPSLTGHRYSLPVLDADWIEHLDDAQKTMQRRVTLSNHLSTTFEESLSDVSSSSEANFHPNYERNISSSALNLVSQESAHDTDSEDSFSDEYAIPDLTNESQLRARSISGASFPYSSRDPRVVSPYLECNCVILPRTARRMSLERDSPVCQRPSLKRRAVSDIIRPRDLIASVSGSIEGQNRPQISFSQANTTIDADARLGVFRMPERSFMYSWEQQKSFCSPSPVVSTDVNFKENHLSLRRRSLSCSDLGLRQRRRQSIRSISANATVRLIDLSRNNMKSLRPIAKAGQELLAYLAKVEKLDLNRNHLSDFPDELSEVMPDLQCVNLSHNEFCVFPYSFITSTRAKLLDISNNKIHISCQCPSSNERAVMLESLNLSHNEIGAIPDWFGDFFPALTSLYLSGNDIRTLPASPLKLWQLRTLDLSDNNLKEIPPEFLSECYSLDTLVATSNNLTSLPESVAAFLTNLKTVRLNKNRLGERSGKKQFPIPRFLLTLPNVKVVDLSSNGLEDIPPPISWATQQLKELVLADNKIRKLSLVGAENWCQLERLMLSDNNLRQVPSGIGELTSLMSLDLSRNAITSLPDEMGRLSNLWDLQLSGLKLDLDSAILESKAQELIGFLHSKLKNSVPYYRMKLVAVGKAGRGKTVLLNQLREDNAAGPHHDIMVRDWYFKDTKAECKVCHRKSVNYVITTWDFKGRDDLYGAYQCLLSSRTLFLVVYDVSKGVSEIDDLRPWLLKIHAYAPDASVMLVGTHKDKIPKDRVDDLLTEIKERALSRCAGPGFPQVKIHVVLDCTAETSGVKTLRQRIMQLIAKCKCKGHSLIGPRVPQNFIDLQQLILQHVSQLELPVLKITNVRRLIQEGELLMDDKEMEQAIKFMTEAGVVVHHDDPACQLKDLLFVDPKWLFHRLACLVTRKATKTSDGILKREELERLLREANGEAKLPSELIPQMIRLLQHYCIALPLREDKYLFPSMLSTKQPTMKIPNTGCSALVKRVYTMAYFPPSFWPRLIARVQTFVVNLYADHKASAETPREPQVQQWNEGVHVHWSDEAFFFVSHGLISPDPDCVVICTPNTKHGARILSHVVDHVDSLLEEWFPDLWRGLDPQNGVPLIKIQAECPVCQDANAHTFDLEPISRKNTEEYVMCPNTKLLVSLRQIAPDIVMEDVAEHLRIEEGKLMLKISRSALLGDGAFGAVYRASYNMKPVAAKVFHPGSENNPYRLLRQEVLFLRNLHHPSIISMVGACMKPMALIMELAPLGSLSTLLNSRQALGRGIQHRIALQVAEGLYFLHHNMIVYRDLKPHNILIFSLSIVNLINAKIADYGIARYATGCGLTATEGTPGYRAPEVAKGDVAYNTEVDMYSFGMFLYELVTGGKVPFEDLRFGHELDAAVMKGRALDPISSCNCSPWPDVADLIAHCLEPQPNRRVTAEEAYSRLCNPELICLKREIAVSKGQTVECMTVRHFKEDNTPRVEVWVGSGQADDLSAQVTIIDLCDKGVEGCTGTFIRDRRVKSILAVDSDTVLAGTLSGTMWVFDAANHKCQFSQAQLPQGILCLTQFTDEHMGVDLVIAGLANGQLAVYDAYGVKRKDAKAELLNLCPTPADGDTPCGECNVYPVACTAVGKKRIFCGCGNEVVVLRVNDRGKLEIERRWNGEDRNEGLVLNIAVTSNFVWTSTRSSPVIECWDFCKAKLVGHVDCMAILKDNGYTGDLRGARVVSLLLSNKTLWVGLGTGHMILIDPSTRKHLSVIRRHMSAVRCLVDTRRPAEETSFVLSGAMGFIARPGHGSTKQTNNTFGHALVWEAEFVKQAKDLECHIKKRRELIESS